MTVFAWDCVKNYFLYENCFHMTALTDPSPLSQYLHSTYFTSSFRAVLFEITVGHCLRHYKTFLHVRVDSTSCCRGFSSYLKYNVLAIFEYCNFFKFLQRISPISLFFSPLLNFCPFNKWPGNVTQSLAQLTQEPELPGSISGLAT